jgi:hypothetical protein
MKKYFVCYWKWSNFSGCWVPNNVIVDKHPLQWFKEECRRSVTDDDNKLVSNYVNDGAIKLGFWEEVQEEDVE